MKRISLVCAVFGVWLLAAGCDVDMEDRGPVETKTVSIDKGTADHANVEIKLGAGHLRLAGGAGKLVEGSLDYAAGKPPKISVEHNNGHDAVTIEQFGDGHSHRIPKHTNWDLRLNNSPLLNLVVHCGAGQAELNLGDTHLRSLEVNIGVGQVDVDLAGKPSHDYDVTIHGGIGQTTVRLPHDVGVWAEAHRGIGSIDVSGLEQHEGHWESAGYDQSKVNVHLTVNGGIGEIRIER